MMKPTQYMCSNDPSVLETLRRTNAALDDMFAAADAFRDDVGADSYEVVRWQDLVFIQRMIWNSPEARPTTFTKTGQPSKRHKDLYQRFIALRWKREALPGHPTNVSTLADRQGRSMTYTAGLFEHDGVVYSEFSEDLHLLDLTPRAVVDETLWEPMKASQWWTMKEAMEGDAV